MDFSNMGHSFWNSDAWQAVACRTEAYDYFQEHVAQLNTSHGLLHCTLSISMHAFEDVSPQEVEGEIERLAALVGGTHPLSSATARIARLHHVLFEQENYAGCDDRHYYHPRNSYFPLMLQSKRGLPIMLSLLYRLVGEKAGLQIQGIRSKGRFLVQVHDDHGPLLVDPFQAGRVLTPSEARQLIDSFQFETLSATENYFPVASNLEWMKRILLNAAYAFERLRCAYDLQAMHNLLALLPAEVA